MKRGVWCALWLLWGCGSEEEVAPAPTVEVTRGPLVYRGSFYGELAARESVSVYAPELVGVDFLTVDTVLPDGAVVKKGDVVLRFVRGPLEDELRNRESDLAVAEAEMRRVEHNLDQERIQLELDVRRKRMAVERAELFVVEGVNLISALDLEKYRLDVEKAKLELKLAEKAMSTFGAKRANALEVQRLKVEAAQRLVDEKRQNLGQMEVKAPTDGLLYGPYTRLNWVRGKVAPGSVCRPGDLLLELPSLAAFDVNLYVRQRDAALLKEGAGAVVSLTAAPERSIKATVARKEDFAATRNERLGTETAEGNLKEIKVVLSLEEAVPLMRPGGTVRADVEVELVSEATLAPLAAIQEEEGEAYVSLPGGERREVVLGQTSLTHAEVLEGLSAGDQVLLGGEVTRALPRPGLPSGPPPP
jgi:multidrug efflux pump subunit AcrA (membrane-fusion protein)